MARYVFSQKTDETGAQIYSPYVDTPRTGQAVNTIGDRRVLPYVDTLKGSFIEESFADHIRGRYVAEELGLPQGLADMPTDNTVHRQKPK